MSVSATIAIQTYDGNGSTVTPYPIDIDRDSNADLFLRIDGVTSSDFTVSPDGFRTGTAIPSGQTLVLHRVTPRTQLNPFPSNTTPAPEDVANAVDKLTFAVQELSGDPQPGAKSLKFPIDEPANFATTLPLPISRIDSFIYFHPTTGALTLLSKTALIALLLPDFKGDPGDTGTPGTNGTNGTNGFSILNGSGAPGGGTGVNGDFYIDTFSFQIYGPKTAGAWGSPTDIIGANGANGANGADGAPGIGLPVGTIGEMAYHNGTNWVVLANPGAPGANTTNLMTHNGTAPLWVNKNLLVLDYCDTGIPATGTFIKF